MKLKEKYPGACNFAEIIGLQDEEAILILIDEYTDKQVIEVLREVFSRNDCKVSVDILPNELTADFSPNIYQKILRNDVIILLASQSWYQAPARKKAKYQHKKRVIESYNLTLEMLKAGALCADYGAVSLFTKEIKELFQPNASIRIEAAKGTAIFAKIGCVFEETGVYDKPGSGGNLPAGEISLGLQAGTMEGEVVFDISFDIIGRLEKAHLKITIDDGTVVKVQGKFKEVLDDLLEKDKRLRNVAEIGIGTNKYAIFGQSVLEDEKKLGTIHIGFGNDSYFGGMVHGPHYDGVLANATIKVDEKPIMVAGHILKV